MREKVMKRITEKDLHNLCYLPSTPWGRVLLVKLTTTQLPFIKRKIRYLVIFEVLIAGL
jgi:hypothetical protein